MSESELKRCECVECHNMVVVKCTLKIKYKYYTSQYFIDTCSGHKRKFFCSGKCLKYFKRHYMCGECGEIYNGHGQLDTKLIYKPNMKKSLCIFRCDYVPSCVDQYNLEKRFFRDYKNLTTKYIGIVSSESRGSNKFHNCKRLTEIISVNRWKISIDMLIDLYYLSEVFETRWRLDDIVIDCNGKCNNCSNLIRDKFYFVMYDSLHCGILCSSECFGNLCDFSKKYINYETTIINCIKDNDSDDSDDSDDSNDNDNDNYIYSDDSNDSD